MKPIVTLTINPALDSFTSADEVRSRIKIRCDAPRFDPGGGGINVARAVRRLGGDALAHYPSAGHTGLLLDDLLAREGVTCCAHRVEGTTRQSFHVLDRSTRREYRFVPPGPELSGADWRACLDDLGSREDAPEWIVASGSLGPGVPDDFYARAARAAADLGARFVLDSSGPPLREALGAGVYLAKPNRREFAAAYDLDPDDEEALGRRARSLVEDGCVDVLVVTLGGDGALLTWAEGQLRAHTPSVELQSDVGAGDSFVGGLTLALARGESMEDAFRAGVAAGTAALLTPGTELCRREDADRLRDEVRVEPL
ncbi:MAG: 1-phosphofructokinase family hexose kinase [Myxococcota bacterium]